MDAEQCTGPFSDARDCPIHRPPDVYQQLRDENAALTARVIQLEAALRQIDELKDMLQLAANKGAFICPLAGRNDKPEKHDYFCAACRVRGLLTPGWYVAPETEMADRATEDREALRWEHITRLEVITEDGRQYVGRNRSIEPSLQDDGRTLKLFLTARAQADEGGRLQAQDGSTTTACTTTATEEQTSGEGTPPTPGSPRA